MTVKELIEDLQKLEGYQEAPVDLMIVVSGTGQCRDKCSEVHLEKGRIIISNDR